MACLTSGVIIAGSIEMRAAMNDAVSNHLNF